MADTPQSTDLELLLAWRQGDAKMGARLFDRHKFAVTNLFRRNVLSRDDIPDLVQETFLACHRSTNDLCDVRHVRNYILGVAFHTMTRFFRKMRHAPMLGVDETRETTLASVEPDSEYLLSLGDEKRLLMKAIRRLKIEFQAVIELNYWEGVPCDEIAAVLGIPQSTARRRLQCGRQALEKKIAELADSEELLNATTMSISVWQHKIQDWIAAGRATPP